MPKYNRKMDYAGGVLPDPISNTGKNWKFLGASDVWEIINELGDWLGFSSPPEKQATRYFDPYNCVSISLAGNIEKWLNYLMSINPSVKPVLELLGLLDKDGKADVSERFIAVGSGTIPGRGNSQYAVYEFVRKNGIVGEKMWPSNEEMSEEEFMSALTPEIRALGKKFLEYFTFEYKDVGESNDELREALKRSPDCVVVGGVQLGANLYRQTSNPVTYNHQVQNYRQDRNVEIFNEVIPVVHKIEDSYEPFLKDFWEKYPFAYAKIIRLVLKKKAISFRLAKTASSPAVYLLCEASLERLGVADSPIEGLTGGELLKKFSGTYGNAGIQVISDEEMSRYKHSHDIKAIPLIN